MSLWSMMDEAAAGFRIERCVRSPVLALALLGLASGAAGQAAGGGDARDPAADDGRAAQEAPAGSPRSTGSAEPFVVRVVDEATGRGVPLVELRTTHGVRFVTDSNGVAALREPGWAGRRVFLHVRSHGYLYPEDGFGFRGVALEVVPGERARIELRRTQVAERLYRVTGEGIYRDSRIAGIAAPVPPSPPAITGMDSVLSAVYRGRVHWFWGDTQRLRYPLGNFHTTGAVSELPGGGGLPPARGIELEYFLDEERFARPVARMPGKGPTWLSGLVVIEDAAGRERLFAHYAKIRNLAGGGFEVYQRGLCRWNDAEERFRHVTTFPEGRIIPEGAHPFLHEAGGRRWIYYAAPYPVSRVPADPEALADPEAYESFTPLRPVAAEDDAAASAGDAPDRRAGGRIEEDGEGHARWRWRAGAPPLAPREEERLVDEGRLAARDRMGALRDVTTGTTVVAHRGTVYRNAYRDRWVMVAGELSGTSFLGETWYAEADGPLGPWVWARKVATHDDYSFYNPKHHPFLDAEGGRRIHFEGTYTRSFSETEEPTARYDYNQVLYRLDLDDPRLHLPVPVRAADGSLPTARPRTGARRGPGGAIRPIAFWALDRAGPRTAPVVEREAGGVRRAGATPGEGGDDGGEGAASPAGDDAADAPVLFHVLRPDVEDPPPVTVPLRELRGPQDRCAWAAQDGTPWPDSWSAVGPPLGRVWPHPLRPVPAGDGE